MDILTVGKADADQRIGDGVFQAIDTNGRAIERITGHRQMGPTTDQETVRHRLLGRLGIEQPIGHLRNQAQQLRAHAGLFPQHVEAVIGGLRDLQIRRTDFVGAKRTHAADQQ